MRLYKGHDINQVSQELKDAVPDEIKTQAREMARYVLSSLSHNCAATDRFSSNPLELNLRND
jgi:HEPN domain-containing protein